MQWGLWSPHDAAWMRLVRRNYDQHRSADATGASTPDYPKRGKTAVYVRVQKRDMYVRTAVARACNFLACWGHVRYDRVVRGSEY